MSELVKSLDMRLEILQNGRSPPPKPWLKVKEVKLQDDLGVKLVWGFTANASG